MIYALNIKDIDILRFGSKQMKLVIIKEIDEEIIHYADLEKVISSRFNRIRIREKDHENTIKLPISISKSLLGRFRLIRRLLRLHKMCVIPSTTGYVVFWQGQVYHLSKDCNKLVSVLEMTGCRNPLYNTVANIGGKEIFFGEYGRPHPQGKSIYRSRDGGLNWEKVYNISSSKIRHIHSCNWDPYEEKVWVFTGDFDGQVYVLCADRDFENVEWIGDGTQDYRAINVFFEKDSVHWLMDSPLQEVHHVKLDRNTRQIEIKQALPGPVWYSKRLEDGYYLAATAQEKGPSHKDKCLHIMVSCDLEKWEDIATFQSDLMPKDLFHYGVITFAEGIQTSQGFYMFFEAVKGFDGKACLCKLDN